MGNLLKIKWIYNVVILGLLCGIGMTWRLWIPTQPIPAFSFIGGVPDAIEWILLIFLVLSLFVQFFFKQWLILPLVSMFSIILLCILDLNRFQPWVYFYFVFLLVLSSYSLRYFRFREWEPILNTSRWLLILLILWSGINKFNPGYFSHVSEYTVSGLASLFGANEKSIHWLAWPVPFIQVLSALSLLIKRFRKIGLIALVITQLLAVFLINIINDWNLAVAPWNIAVITLLLISFSGKEQPLELFTSKKNTFLKALVVLVGTIPAFRSFLAVPPIQFSLYSGKALYGFIYIEKDTVLNDDFPDKAIIDLGNYTMIDIAQWSDYEYHLPLYPTEGNFREIEKHVKQEYPNRDVFLKLTSYN